MQSVVYNYYSLRTFTPGRSQPQSTAGRADAKAEQTSLRAPGRRGSEEGSVDSAHMGVDRQLEKQNLPLVCALRSVEHRTLSNYS